MPHGFKDTVGKDWLVEINIGALKRVRGLLDLDLLALEAGDPPLLTRLGLDIVLICDVLFALLKPQADAADVTDEQFAERLGGEVILAAHKAFYEELTDFFQSLGRNHMATAVQKQLEMIDAGTRLADEKLKEINIDAEAKLIFGDQSTSSPASAE